MVGKQAAGKWDGWYIVSQTPHIYNPDPSLLIQVGGLSSGLHATLLDLQVAADISELTVCGHGGPVSVSGSGAR